MPSVFTLEGPRLSPAIPNGKSKGFGPEHFDPTQLAIGTQVEMEHTSDVQIAQRIAMDHLVEDPLYYQKLKQVHLDGVKPWAKWLLVGLGVAGISAAVWYGYRKRGGLRGLGLTPQDIARESKSPEDYARRIEAWNSSEAKPLSVDKLAKLYRNAKPATVAKLIHEAREARETGRERLWSKMSRGLRGGQREIAAKYRLASAVVDGRIVRDSIPNTSSIKSLLTNYKMLPGVREVPFSAFDQMGPLTYYSISEAKRTKNLATQINESKEITPLIVVEDAEGPYILEGGHRFDALRELGAKSFPALIVLDLDSLDLTR